MIAPHRRWSFAFVAVFAFAHWGGCNVGARPAGWWGAMDYQWLTLVAPKDEQLPGVVTIDESIRDRESPSNLHRSGDAMKATAAATVIVAGAVLMLSS